ncbi:MAG: hypothetical protein O7F71_11925 [Gammaproteobacteria bacterium]|nr:hypothetical protein [Gammaproteobacteria bacterium]
MNWLDWLPELSMFQLPDLTGVPDWVLITVVGGIVAVVLLWKLSLAERKVGRLSREFVIFAEASTQVALTLDQLLSGKVAPSEQPAASRRHLIAQAHQGLNEGEPIEKLAKRLGLCHDEINLMAARKVAVREVA